ncbi:MAG: hypothetical protein AAGK74_08345 [Chloroflexota bacterium]
MSDFSQKLARIQAKNGSDVLLLMRPLMSDMPAPMHYYDDPFFPFSKAIIGATRDVVCGYVFDFPAYLVHGAAGAVALERSMAFAGADVLKILHGTFVGAGYAPMIYEDALGSDAATIAYSHEYNDFAGRDGREAFVLQWGDEKSGDYPAYLPEQNRFLLADGEHLRVADEKILYTGYQDDFAQQCRAALEAMRK